MTIFFVLLSTCIVYFPITSKAFHEEILDLQFIGINYSAKVTVVDLNWQDPTQVIKTKQCVTL